jgi:hypothetical protein
MSYSLVSPEKDLWLPLPEPGQVWPAHLLHTYYFGLSVPDAQIGAYIYIRVHPRFPLCQGGVCIFQGMDNLEPLDMAHTEYQMTMPWPEVDGNVITTANGLRVEFLELGKKARVSYESKDGTTRFDTIHEAIMPMIGQSHLMPGEEDRQVAGLEKGRFEQFVHCTGSLDLNGDHYDIDCYPVRDRSWSQVRTEDQEEIPPLGWNPMCFGEADLAFNAVSYESLDTNPYWRDIYPEPPFPPEFYGWIYEKGEIYGAVEIRRDVLEYHPRMTGAIKQHIQVTDERGVVHNFRGQAIAMTNLPQWYNASIRDSVYRWEDDQGRISYCTYQEVHYGRFQREMNKIFPKGNGR